MLTVMRHEPCNTPGKNWDVEVPGTPENLHVDGVGAKNRKIACQLPSWDTGCQVTFLSSVETDPERWQTQQKGRLSRGTETQGRGEICPLKAGTPSVHFNLWRQGAFPQIV